MTPKEWEAEAVAMAAAHDRPGEPEPDVVRTRLVEIDRLLRTAPAAIARLYKAIPEQKLRDWAIEAEARLQDGVWTWLQVRPVEAAAAQARALDHFLFHHRSVRGKPDDPNLDFLCPASGMHVVPREAARPHPDPARVGTMTYRRRGLVWHRLLPRVTQSGHVVDLQWHRDMFLSFRSPNARVVSALFEDLSLERDQDFVNFVAKAAPCRDEEASLRAHVDAAFATGVVIALWPELTMPEERRRGLADALLAKSRSAPLGTGPAFAAAGSWHEVDGTRVRNRMHVLSRSGQARFHHDKSMPLESKTLGTEELEASGTLAVLIMEDALVAFAICRDFCEDQIARAYLELDVDLVVVPSYGDRKTIDAHRHMAQSLSNDPGSRTFVVQQIVPEEVQSAGQGYVLPPEADAGSAAAKDLVLNDLATSHPISFKRV